MKKPVLINLNFDDFHPEDGPFGDFGGTPKEGTFKLLTDLLVTFPWLTITLFTTPNWIDAPYTRHRYFYRLKEMFHQYPVVPFQKGEPYHLLKHPLWVQEVKHYVDQGRFEIALHGLFHNNPHSRLHSQEFAGLSREETRKRIDEGENIFSRAGFSYTKAFRPPGWGMNPHLASVLREKGYLFLASDSTRAHISRVEEKDGLLRLPQNWSIRSSFEEAQKTLEETGTLFMKGHLVYRSGVETIENGITKEFWDTLVRVLHYIEETYEPVSLSLQELATRQKSFSA